VQAAGSNSGVWGAGGSSGDDLNTGVMGLIDTQLAGVVTNSVSSSNVTLSYANVQNCMLRFTGTLLASINVSPDTGGSPAASTYFNGFYFFENVTSGSFTITLVTNQGSVVLPQSRRGILFADQTNAPRIVAITGSTAADPIPVGTPMLFYSSAAPTGWTLSGLNNNYALRIVSSGGGVTGGSVGFATLFSRTGTDGHTLTSNEIPSHSHVMFGPDTASSSNPLTADTDFATMGLDQSSFSTNYLMTKGNSPTRGRTNTTGGGVAHTHDIDMRVLYADFVICTKN